LTEHVEGDTENRVDGLPSVTPELFLKAGLILAERASRAFAGPSVLEELLRKAVRQVTALPRSASASVNHG
jgi:hypothetical protein